MDGSVIIGFIIAGLIMSVGVLIWSNIEPVIACPLDAVSDTFVAVTASSTQNNLIMNLTADTTSNQVHSAGNTIVGERVVNTASLLYDQPIFGFTAKMIRTGSPTGNVTFGVFDSTGNLVHFFGNHSIAEISSVNIESIGKNSTAYRPTVGDVIGIQFTGGDASNRLNVRFQSQSFDGADSVRSTFQSGTWTDVANDFTFIIYVNASSASNAIDGNVNTYWQSGVPQEAGTSIYGDLGSTQQVMAVRIYSNNTSYIPATIRIFVSDDNSNFGSPVKTTTLSQSVGYQTVTLSNTDPPAGRYVKIEVDTWGTDKLWRVGEFSVHVVDVTDEGYGACANIKNTVWTVLSIAPFVLFFVLIGMFVVPRLM